MEYMYETDRGGDMVLVINPGVRSGVSLRTQPVGYPEGLKGTKRLHNGIMGKAFFKLQATSSLSIGGKHYFSIENKDLSQSFSPTLPRQCPKSRFQLTLKCVGGSGNRTQDPSHSRRRRRPLNHGDYRDLTHLSW